MRNMNTKNINPLFFKIAFSDKNFNISEGTPSDILSIDALADTKNFVLNRVPNWSSASVTNKLFTTEGNNQMSYDVKPSTKEYIWSNGKVQYTGGNLTNDVSGNQSLEFDKSYLSSNNIRNRNTDIVNSDWPGMFGLQAPSPATLRYIATGNGDGGEIIQRNQIKSAAVTDMSDYNNFISVENKPIYSETPGAKTLLGVDNPQKGTYMTRATLYPSLERLTHNFSGWLPFRYIGEASKRGGKLLSTSVGGLSGASLGAIMGLIRNLNRKPKVVKDEFGEYDIVDEEPMWKDILIGSAIGGLGGGVLGYNLNKDLEFAKFLKNSLKGTNKENGEENK